MDVSENGLFTGLCVGCTAISLVTEVASWVFLSPPFALGVRCLMFKVRVTLLFLALTISEIAVANIPVCLATVAPLEPIKLVWPGLPSGGYKQLLNTEVVSLRFLVLPTGATSEITIVSSTSKVYLRSAKRTIANTKFTHEITACSTVMDLKYEPPRS